MKIFVETDRFYLREMQEQDIDGLFELDSDPEVHKYLGNKPLKNKEECAKVIDWVRYQYVANGIGRWAIIEKQTSDFMGWAGLKWNCEADDLHGNHYDLGYRIVRRFWGQSIAYQCAKLTLEYGFGVMNISEIYAAAHIDNVASNRILQKIGMQLVEIFQYDNADHNWYKIHNHNHS